MVVDDGLDAPLVMVLVGDSVVAVTGFEGLWVHAQGDAKSDETQARGARREVIGMGYRNGWSAVE